MFSIEKFLGMPFYSGEDGFYQEKTEILTSKTMFSKEKFLGMPFYSGEDGFYQEKQKF